MANTPEHLTLTQHRSDIVIALADEVCRLSDELFARGLISGDNAKAVKNPKQISTTRAFQLTKFILDRVKRNPREYDAFIDVLNERPDEHRDILGVLDTSYQQLKLKFDEQNPSWLKVCWWVMFMMMVTVISLTALLMIIYWALMFMKSHTNSVTNGNPILNTSLVPGASFIYFETVTLNDDSKVIQTIDLSQFGLKLYFQPNTSLEPVTIAIGVIESQNFITPPNTTLVSALYYIYASLELLQPVIIEIEHCVNIDSVNNARLTFARADTDSSPHYAFKKLSNGRFGRTSFGTIKLSNFSEVAICAENASSVNYLAQFFSSPRTGPSSVYRYRVDLVISRELNAIKEVIKRDYSKWIPVTRNPISFTFHRESAELALDINEDGIQSGNWEIKPTAMPPTIERSAVGVYSYVAFELKVSCTNKGEEEAPLEYFLKVQGISRKSFLIFIDPYENGTSTIDSGHHIHEEHLQCTKIDVFKHLYDSVHKVGNWRGLCLHLGVHDAIMNALRHSNKEIEVKKEECLQAYYNSGEAYWEEVVRALIKHPINNKRLGKEIIEQNQLRTDLLDESRIFLCDRED